VTNRDKAKTSKVGAFYDGQGTCTFRVWAPEAQDVKLRFFDSDDQDMPMVRDDRGYWRTEVDDVTPGCRYMYVLDGDKTRPDPASAYQPEGVHGPSAVVDHSVFRWSDAGWESVPLEDMIIYELHVGTFTSEGTFKAIISRVSELHELGINTIELMPVAQFPGGRNWGYDGVFPYAVQNSYGGPEGLKTLVDAIHRQGMSVILDVVYNHLGPEGNYFWDYAPYFTDAYQTPWGQAINFDRTHSHHVRNYFIQNALHWLRDYHIDALRLDALHAICDMSAKHFVRELVDSVGAFSRRTGHKRYLIGESNLNDVRFLKSPRSGGYGLDSQWSDDFHHALHVLLTGERKGYYIDFGDIRQLAKALKEGFVYSWQYSPFRQCFFGSSSRTRPARQFVICSQNHDQVGNRMCGERLTHLIDFESLKLGAGTLLLAPYVPMLFMGQEYGENAPFLYFVSHSDEELVEAVRQGRKSEFAAFHGAQECPDPQSVETFIHSKLRWETRMEGRHGILREFYKYLLKLRKGVPQMVSKENLSVRAIAGKQVLTWQRIQGRDQMYCLMNFSDRDERFMLHTAESSCRKILDSADLRWEGPGTQLPAEVHDRQEVSMPRRSIALYRLSLPDASENQVAAAAHVSIVEGI